jgi:hypothetical protein
MSTLEKDCAYCRQPIRLNGLVPPEGVCLVVDQVFHDKCWDEYRAKYHRKGSAARGETRWIWRHGLRSAQTMVLTYVNARAARSAMMAFCQSGNPSNSLCGRRTRTL